jgi:bacterioferritin-associated ferredoxin
MNMPQLNQPMRLEEVCKRLHINKYCGKCEKWMQDLLDAMKGDKYAYKVVFDTVVEECREMEE